MDVETLVEGARARSLGDYDIALEVLRFLADEVDVFGDLIGTVGIAAGALVGEFDLDEDDVQEAFSDVIDETGG